VAASFAGSGSNQTRPPFGPMISGPCCTGPTWGATKMSPVALGSALVIVTAAGVRFGCVRYHHTSPFTRGAAGR
jgi:hypothetical protein